MSGEVWRSREISGQKTKVSGDWFGTSPEQVENNSHKSNRQRTLKGAYSQLCLNDGGGREKLCKNRSHLSPDSRRDRLIGRKGVMKIPSRFG